LGQNIRCFPGEKCRPEARWGLGEGDSGTWPFLFHGLGEHSHVERLVEKYSSHELDRRVVELKPATDSRDEASQRFRSLLKDFTGFGFTLEKQRRETRQIVLLRTLRPVREFPQRIQAKRAKNLARKGGDEPAGIEVK
jgi:hypothetical protein